MCDDELNDMEWTETDAMTDSAEPDADAGRVLLGVDLGTSRTAVMSSRGAKKMVPSVVGYPTDLIGVKLLGAPFVVGQKALDQRSFLELRYPVEDGVLREYSARDLEVARHLMTHMIEVADTKPDDEICAVIGAPARASATNKALLLKLAQETVDMALVVSDESDPISLDTELA